MRKVLLFMMVSLDGYFEGTQADISWHVVDDEFNKFAIRQLDSVDMLLFGRKTYELMASYWPTQLALEDDPIVAGKMNSTSKLVFSKSLSSVDWQNTRLVKTDVVGEIARLKSLPGKDMIIFGSSDLAVSFLQHDLLDECRIMVSPVVLGGGKTLFQGLQHEQRLKLVETRAFHSGNVLLVYQPEKNAA